MNGPFRISERTHSGFILMTRLAEVHGTDARLSLKEIAEGMPLSEGYLEEIAAALKNAGLIQGRTGPKGGYVLTRDPSDITAEDILVAIEGPIAIVECQTAVCPVEGSCVSRTLWGRLQQNIRASLHATRLSEIR